MERKQNPWRKSFKQMTGGMTESLFPHRKKKVYEHTEVTDEAKGNYISYFRTSKFSEKRRFKKGRSKGW